MSTDNSNRIMAICALLTLAIAGCGLIWDRATTAATASGVAAQAERDFEAMQEKSDKHFDAIEATIRGNQSDTEKEWKKCQSLIWGYTMTFPRFDEWVGQANEDNQAIHLRLPRTDVLTRQPQDDSNGYPGSQPAQADRSP